jgi:hypothetical protein
MVRGQRSALNNRLRDAGCGVRVWDAGDMDMECKRGAGYEMQGAGYGMLVYRGGGFSAVFLLIFSVLISGT